jgi:hypothetical protein
MLSPRSCTKVLLDPEGLPLELFATLNMSATLPFVRLKCSVTMPELCSGE